MIELKHVSKTVTTGDRELSILHGIDLEIKAGESVAIIGPSGSGKSTLLGLMAGLDEVSSGEVWLAGECLQSMDEDQRAALRARRVGFVFQSFHLLSGLTALENIMLPLELKGRSDAREQAAMYCERVGLAERQTHYPKQLSGGEQQRVALARAFAAEPDVLFADEPTGNLDAATGERIIELLFDLNEKSSATLVLVTHEARLANLCQRRIALEAGKLASAHQEVL